MADICDAIGHHDLATAGAIKVPDPANANSTAHQRPPASRSADSNPRHEATAFPALSPIATRARRAVNRLVAIGHDSQLVRRLPQPRPSCIGEEAPAKHRLRGTPMRFLAPKHCGPAKGLAI
jgi:hypothetical protein